MVFLGIAQINEQDAWNDAFSILHMKGLFNNHYILSLEWHFKPFLPWHLIIALFASQTKYANPHNTSLQWNEKLSEFYCWFSSLLPPGQKPPSDSSSHLVGISWADKVKPSRSEIITKAYGKSQVCTFFGKETKHIFQITETSEHIPYRFC